MEKKFPPVIQLNVGGFKFTTKLSTIQKFPKIMSAVGGNQKDKDGCYFIDRNGKYFDHILEFLRDDQYLPPMEKYEDVLKDAEYFCVIDLVNRLKGLPPLFPFYGIKEEIRKNVKNYSQFKEHIIEIAKSGAPNCQTKDFSISTSEVAIKTLNSTRNENTHLYVSLTNENYSRLPKTENENPSFFTENNTIKNFEALIHTILKDLRQYGISVDLSKVVHVASRTYNTIEEVNNEMYQVVDYAILRFEWFEF